MRQLNSYVFDPELTSGKMIFISGPRQIGKTTFAKNILESRQGAYFNWDNPAVRKEYYENPFFFLKKLKQGSGLVVFDEIHKRAGWKDILKGCFDSTDKSIEYLVTGSARLETFRKSGDSLIGRYLMFRMLPFSMSELNSTPLTEKWGFSGDELNNPSNSFLQRLSGSSPPHGSIDAVDSLIKFGGFPEPLFKNSERFLRKWKSDYISLLIGEDLRDLTNIKDLDRMEKLVSLLPAGIGSPASVNSLSKTLETSFHTVKNSLNQLERLWLTFSLSPYSAKISRSIKKEKKIYFINWIYAPEKGQRFENFIASQLHRACSVMTDYGLGEFSLRYLRTIDKAEADFLIIKDDKPVVVIESKLTQATVSKSSVLLAQKLNIPYIQVINTYSFFKKINNNCYVTSTERLLDIIP